MARKGFFSDTGLFDIPAWVRNVAVPLVFGEGGLKDTLNGLMSYSHAGVLQHGTLAVDSDATKFKTTTPFIWRRNGIQFTKVPATGLTFSDAHVVTAEKFGVVLIQVDDEGVVTTKVPGEEAQAFDDELDALAALPECDDGNTAMGCLVIEAGQSNWTANTDDLTDDSDVASAQFVDAAVAVLPDAIGAE